MPYTISVESTDAIPEDQIALGFPSGGEVGYCHDFIFGPRCTGRMSKLGPWRFPRGKDGKSRRWKELKMDLSNDHPLLLGLGTPIRSELVNRGHTGQLVRARPGVGMRKYFPLLPEAQARRDQLGKLNARE
ncbi:hypothetical protein L873DRAFT_1792882 [Choiromyces venosus 120613-1]|uniref:Uncharacterized protein n=1 Tax=Choiromyces venosus 120613-1 TaxID=1336337 RepID=A0A3N4J8N0_9PEZI|nr:hypothetical protein L873DRAFT_1792882 [Choiromyces venosus 120613-1]